MLRGGAVVEGGRGRGRRSGGVALREKSDLPDNVAAEIPAVVVRVVRLEQRDRLARAKGELVRIFGLKVVQRIENIAHRRRAVLPAA